ncbi:nuclear transport factor 2 family protein [Vibrio sinaloensis]|uniref:nuclear transport factor 2 family protein n=1 Tax=Photobacterium sp. (strain ATCC 43367) TaxID=379097 RepID=UPI0035E876B5
MVRKSLVLALGLTALTAHAGELTRDEAKIAQTAKSMATLADRNLYDALEQVFTPVVVVDYTSAFGGEVSTIKREDLMNNWEALLPGFDVTYHDMTNIDIEQKGNKAEVNADIVASHYIGKDGFWQISGSYTLEMEKAGSDWQISSLTLNAGDELGSRDVLGRAIEAAKTK